MCQGKINFIKEKNGLKSFLCRLLGMKANLLMQNIQLSRPI
jgi:hypothetical protein